MALPLVCPSRRQTFTSSFVRPNHHTGQAIKLATGPAPLQFSSRAVARIQAPAAFYCVLARPIRDESFESVLLDVYDVPSRNIATSAFDHRSQFSIVRANFPDIRREAQSPCGLPPESAQ
jgi:hypothetical protein